MSQIALTESAPAASKRARLVEAAKALFHQQGVEATTLADIAEYAHVPLGNVYYYFRTKDDLVTHVIAAHLADLQARFAGWDQATPDPRQRLRLFVQDERDGTDILVRHGCPYGSLASELDKGETALVPLVAELFQVTLAWAAGQFCLLGNEGQEARALAEAFLASLQGSFMLANALRSPALLAQQLDRLDTWLLSL
jgi:TetR/AcrR family transcriptional regulator, transcriptional repressor for nem operon